jgi:hypothetical protein
MKKYVLEMEELKNCKECGLLGLNGNEEIICQVTGNVFAANGGDTENDFDMETVHESCPLGKHIDATLDTTEMDDESLNNLMMFICNQLGVRPQKMAVRVERVKAKLKEVFNG